MFSLFFEHILENRRVVFKVMRSTRRRHARRAGRGKQAHPREHREGSNTATKFTTKLATKIPSRVKSPSELNRKLRVRRRFQWYIAEGMLSLPTAKWSMVISFFSGVMASGFAFGCAKDTVEFFNAGIGEVRFPVGEGFLLVIFDYVGPWV